MVDHDTGVISEALPVEAIPFVRSANNYDVDLVSRMTAYVEDQETKTQQQFKDDSDINVMMERFGLGHPIPQNFRLPSYGDFSDVSDYRSAWDAVFAMQNDFMELPARVRAEFANDPQRFLEFVSNDGNKERMREMGLLKEPEKRIVVDVGNLPSSSESVNGNANGSENAGSAGKAGGS